MQPIGSAQALNGREMFTKFHRQHVMKFYTKLDMRAHEFVQIFTHTLPNDTLQSLIYVSTSYWYRSRVSALILISVYICCRIEAYTQASNQKCAFGRLRNAKSMHYGNIKSSIKSHIKSSWCLHKCRILTFVSLFKDLMSELHYGKHQIAHQITHPTSS